MEQFRLLLAIGLSFLVLFVWSMFFVDRQPVIDNQKVQITEKMTAEKQAPINTGTTTGNTISPDAIEEMQAAQIPENQGREITVETPFYSVRISAKGASFTSYILKKYRESVEKDSPNKQLIPETFKNGVIRTSLSGKSLKGLDEAIFSIDQAGDRLVVYDSPKALSFNWVAHDGNIVNKTYTFDPDSYLIDLKVVLKIHQNGC